MDVVYLIFNVIWGLFLLVFLYIIQILEEGEKSGLEKYITVCGDYSLAKKPFNTFFMLVPPAVIVYNLFASHGFILFAIGSILLFIDIKVHRQIYRSYRNRISVNYEGIKQLGSHNSKFSVNWTDISAIMISTKPKGLVFEDLQKNRVIVIERFFSDDVIYKLAKRYLAPSQFEKLGIALEYLRGNKSLRTTDIPFYEKYAYAKDFTSDDGSVFYIKSTVTQKVFGMGLLLLPVLIFIKDVLFDTSITVQSKLLASILLIVFEIFLLTKLHKVFMLKIMLDDEGITSIRFFVFKTFIRWCDIEYINLNEDLSAFVVLGMEKMKISFPWKNAGINMFYNYLKKHVGRYQYEHLESLVLKDEQKKDQS